MEQSDILNQLLGQEHLSPRQVEDCLDKIITGKWTEVQIAGFLIALRTKGEQPAELAAGAKFLQRHCVPVATADPAQLLDTAGTGGDNQGTFNISTAAAFVAAATGVSVAKHGNRAQSGICGSADLLAALGCRLDMSPERISACLAQTGICFIFAQAHHPSLKAVASVRKQLKVRTLFNLLGPLINPAGAQLRLVGVFADEWVLPYAQACQIIGMRRALIVHAGGLDEFSLVGKSHYALLDESGEITEHEVSAAQLGVPCYPIKQLQVADQAEALSMFNQAIDNEDCPARDSVVLNAAAAVFAAGKVAGLERAVEVVRATLAAGKARAKLDEFIEFNSF